MCVRAGRALHRGLRGWRGGGGAGRVAYQCRHVSCHSPSRLPSFLRHFISSSYLGTSTYTRQFNGDFDWQFCSNYAIAPQLYCDARPKDKLLISLSLFPMEPELRCWCIQAIPKRHGMCVWYAIWDTMSDTWEAMWDAWDSLDWYAGSATLDTSYATWGTFDTTWVTCYKMWDN